MSAKTKMWVRAAIDYGPLIAFLAITQFTGNAITASLVIVPVSLAALACAWIMERRIAPMPLVTAILAVVFGGLTVLLHDERIIKMKPTVLYAGFGAFLLSGFARGKNALKALMGDAFHLPEPVVRTLTLRYALMFFALAAANEVIWRTQSTRVWAFCKFPGAAILIFLFAMSQTPLIMKYMPDEDAEATPPAPNGEAP
jgi:intracellular septation protein